MKFTKYSFLGVFVLLFALLYSGSPQAQENDESRIQRLLHAKISERNASLTALFLKGKNALPNQTEVRQVAEEMAKHFSEDASFVTPKKENIKGTKEIAKYWESVIKRSEAKAVTFKYVNHFTHKKSWYDLSKETGKIEEFTHSASESGKYTIIVSHNPNQESGTFTTSLRHRQSCPWE